MPRTYYIPNCAFVAPYRVKVCAEYYDYHETLAASVIHSPPCVKLPPHSIASITRATDATAYIVKCWTLKGTMCRRPYGMRNGEYARSVSIVIPEYLS